MSHKQKLKSPTDIARASRCLYSWQLECFGDSAKKLEPDAGMKLVFERGLQEERRRVGELGEFATTGWDGRDWSEGARLTREAMSKGAEWIYQGVLLAEWGGRGQPDLLKRVTGFSSLGPFGYLPVDVKGHKEVTTKDRIQLAAYARMLEPILGELPRRGGIWLNTGQIEEIDLSRDLSRLDRLLSKMQAIEEGRAQARGARNARRVRGLPSARTSGTVARTFRSFTGSRGIRPASSSTRGSPLGEMSPRPPRRRLKLPWG